MLTVWGLTLHWSPVGWLNADHLLAASISGRKASLVPGWRVIQRLLIPVYAAIDGYADNIGLISLLMLTGYIDVAGLHCWLPQGETEET